VQHGSSPLREFIRPSRPQAQSNDTASPKRPRRSETSAAPAIHVAQSTGAIRRQDNADTTAIVVKRVPVPRSKPTITANYAEGKGLRKPTIEIEMIMTNYAEGKGLRKPTIEIEIMRGDKV
jgi:hypothetical protein